MLKCSSVIYINKKDPRIFVYKNQTRKWFGVTLNFAHTKSLVVLFGTLLGLLVITLLSLHFLQYSWGVLFSLILFILWVIALICYCYREAAKDLRKYPGNPSVR